MNSAINIELEKRFITLVPRWRNRSRSRPWWVFLPKGERLFAKDDGVDQEHGLHDEREAEQALNVEVEGPKGEVSDRELRPAGKEQDKDVVDHGATAIALWCHATVGLNPEHTIYAFSICITYWNCNEKRTKINKKRPG